MKIYQICAKIIDFVRGETNMKEYLDFYIDRDKAYDEIKRRQDNRNKVYDKICSIEYFVRELDVIE